MASEVSSLRLSIRLESDVAVIGIAAEGCDPLWEKVRGELPEVLAQVPGLVERARERWGEAPRYPTYARPAAPPAQASSRTVQSSPRAGQARGGTTGSQENRLF